MKQTFTNADWARLVNHSARLRAAAEGFIYNYLKPFVDADDIVSETLQYAYQRPQQWQHIPDGEIIFYLRKMAKFFILRKARNLKLHREILVEGMWVLPEVAEKPAPGDLPPVKAIHNREKIKAVDQVLQRIKHAPHRQVLDLIWLRGKPVEEAARIMGRTTRATAILMRRALKACREIAMRASFEGFRVSGETR